MFLLIKILLDFFKIPMLISIHPMFLLIQKFFGRLRRIEYFNTSHVSINLPLLTSLFDKYSDFNTSHVSINPCRDLRTET